MDCKEGTQYYTTIAGDSGDADDMATCTIYKSNPPTRPATIYHVHSVLYSKLYDT